MKILVYKSSGGSMSVRSGWIRCFEACGHQCIFWNPQEMPTHDLFYYHPDIDLAILTTYDLDRSLFKCIKSHPSMKVIMFCSAWGELTDSLNREEFPIVYVTDEEKKNIELLRKETGKPDYVFIHITKRFKDATIGGWEKNLGIKTVGILNAADTFMYLGGKYRQEYACDIGMVSGYWPYKARNIDPIFGPLAVFPPKYRVKVFGYGWKDYMYYHGSLCQADEKDLYASAKICPNISEPHSTQVYCDLTERVMKIACAGGFCIQDKVVHLEDIFDSQQIPRFKNYNNFIELVDFYLNNESERHKVKIAAFDRVIQKHTYFDRIELMLEELELTEESKKVALKKKEILKSYL